MTRIIPWSGGPDSTYLLTHLLNDSDDEVVALTVYPSHDPKEYSLAVDKATRNISALLSQRLRPFTHIDYHLQSPIGRRSDETQAAAILVALQYDEPHIQWASVTADTPRIFPDSLGPLAEKLANEEDVNEGVTKKKIKNYLGEDIWSLTQSCFHPKKDLQACGQCYKCRERASA